MKKVILLALALILCVALCGCKSEEVKATEAAIEEIGEVTLDSGDAIAEAEELYDDLPEDEQEDVENYSVLEDAREEYNELRVEEVEELIDDIGTVTIDSGDAIDEAKAAYNELDKDLQEEVGNYDDLTAAEGAYAFEVTLAENTITNYTSVKTTLFDNFDEPISVWYSDKDASATLFILFLLQGEVDGQLDIDLIDIDAAYVCIIEEDNRVDIYLPYDGNKIMGMQYWPEEGKAQVGTIETDMAITVYVDLLTEGGIIDKYSLIPLDNIVRILNIMMG